MYLKLYLKNIKELLEIISVELEFEVGEGILILDPLNLCFMRFQKLRNLIANLLFVVLIVNYL